MPRPPAAWQPGGARTPSTRRSLPHASLYVGCLCGLMRPRGPAPPNGRNGVNMRCPPPPQMGRGVVDGRPTQGGQ